MPYQATVPATSRFHAVPLAGPLPWARLDEAGFSPAFVALAPQVPTGDCVFWGMRFAVSAQPLTVVAGQPAASVALGGLRAGWLVFAHTSDFRPLTWNEHGFVTANPGHDRLGELAATYRFRYADGREEVRAVRRGHEVGQPPGRWGANCTQAIFHGRNQPVDLAGGNSPLSWGWAQTRVHVRQQAEYTHWLWAWRNPHPEVPLAELVLEPGIDRLVVAGLVAGEASEEPLRWRARRKAVLTLPAGTAGDTTLDADGLLAQVRLDLGMVISAVPRLVYPVDDWPASYGNQLPAMAPRQLLLEYTSHADAEFHLADGIRIPVAAVEGTDRGPVVAVAPATQAVRIRVVDEASGQPVAVKLHLHGEAGEYLAPLDRHRQTNPGWYEDYAPEFVHQWRHATTYIPGETVVKLPLGRVFLEVSKGFEIRPVRRVEVVTPATREIVVRLARVLPWSARGWRSADTHVHFLSPTTGLLEGAAEDVHVVNLLASQWGELMTNVGDFDGGETTHRRRESGVAGEYLLRVGTENRQHVLGHISLLGYRGPAIVPMCCGGPEEAAFGDPVESLITEWARQCREQGGLVVIPHHPRPRLEAAATFVEEAADAVEFCSWADLYAGLDPYSLSDWYRYLNCGYLVAAVGGTDKMAAVTAVGTCRSYARLAPDEPFTYESWLRAVKRAETFVTYGPLLEFQVEGRPMGSRLALNAAGGTVDCTWEVASVTVPMSRVELLANGAIVASQVVAPEHGAGHFTVKVDRSTWLALLVRGHYADQPEIIAAHSTPVMVDVAGSAFFSAADALTILAQIEGAMAYLDTLGTRAETAVYQRMRLVLTSAHRRLHNRMHEQGADHRHTPATRHPGHERS